MRACRFTECYEIENKQFPKSKLIRKLDYFYPSLKFCINKCRL